MRNKSMYIFNNSYKSCKFLRLTIWMLFYISLVCCDSKNKVLSNPSVHDSLADSKLIEESTVLQQAKIFLHLIKGVQALQYYNDPDVPPSASFFPERKIWNVFFYSPTGGINIELSEDATKANYIFRSGSKIAEVSSGEVSSNDKLVLYSPSKMIDLLNMPHNGWVK